MNFYTNVFKYGKFLLVRGYNNEKRFRKKIEYKPYLFIPSKKESKYKTLQGQSVDRLDFADIYEAKEFTKKYDNVSGFNFFGLDRWEYTYIHDNYPGRIEFDKNLIRTVGLDIEVDTEDGYPDIELANKKITAITCRLGDRRFVWGYGAFVSPDHTVKYFKCKTEEELLESFLTWWNHEENSPDAITGWNIEGFDIPYLVKRISSILSENDAKRLSPWGILRDRMIFNHGKQVKIFLPMGLAVLDYMRLYKKFELSQKNSYSLNNICSIELDEKKIDYSEYKDLAGLYKNNHQKFIEYNIRDVDLIFKLEGKLSYLELVYTVAYDAKVNIADAFTSVLLWDIIAYNYLMDRNIVVPQPRQVVERSFEGAYVKEPLLGLHEHVVSVDVTSEYPKTIIQYNISPETLVRKIDLTVEECLRGVDVPEQYALAPNGCMFRKDIQGFLPGLMELQFAQRKEFQKKMKEEPDPLKKVKYDKAQYAKKIQLNSLYGVLGNRGYRYYDPDFAEATTAGGRLAIKFQEREVNNFMNKICKTEGEDYIIAVDTDSLYIKFDKLVKMYCKGNAIDFIDKVVEDKLLPVIRKGFVKLAEQMNAMKNAMEMKRENIADKGLWTAKKRYIMNVWDKEGDRYKKPKLKIMGIETVRSSSPSICRTALEEAISIIMNKNEAELQKYIASFKKQFFKAAFDEVAFPRGVNDLEKYRDSATVYKKGSPIQVRAAILYNKLLKDRKIKTEEPIYSGDKIKFAYLKVPNPVQDNVIGAPGFLPFEDIANYIDYHMQWEKAFLEPLNAIISLIGWHEKEQESLGSLFM